MLQCKNPHYMNPHYARHYKSKFIVSHIVLIHIVWILHYSIVSLIVWFFFVLQGNCPTQCGFGYNKSQCKATTYLSSSIFCRSHVRIQARGHSQTRRGVSKILENQGIKWLRKGGWGSKIAKNLFTWFVNALKQDYMSISISFH